MRFESCSNRSRPSGDASSRFKWDGSSNPKPAISNIVTEKFSRLTLEYTPDCMLKVMDAQFLQIGEVAQKTGLSVDAILFYEKQGLVPRPARTQGGYRLYRQPEIADLEVIHKAQQLGLSLKEIRELFSIQRHPEETCVHVRDLIAQKLGVVRGKMEELQTLEGALAASLKHCRRALRRPADRRDSCPPLEQIAAARPQTQRK